MGETRSGAELGRGGSAAGDRPRSPSGRQEIGLDRGFAEGEFDPAKILLHGRELIGQDSGAVGIDLADGDDLVVADAGAEHQGDAIDLSLEAGGQALFFLGRARLGLKREGHLGLGMDQGVRGGAEVGVGFARAGLDRLEQNHLTPGGEPGEFGRLGGFEVAARQKPLARRAPETGRSPGSLVTMQMNTDPAGLDNPKHADGWPCFGQSQEIPQPSR